MREELLTARAKALRIEQTPAERALWHALRAERFESTKSRRQKVIGRYIVDFAARDPMLVVEVDGDTHADREIQDGVRTAFLEAQGYKVTRLTNGEVMGNLEGVLTAIQAILARPPLPTLSPDGERAL